MITTLKSILSESFLPIDLSHVHNKKVHTATLKSRTKLQSQHSEYVFINILLHLSLTLSRRSTILVTLEPQRHMSYQPGDHIAIYAQNNPNLVKELLGRLNLPCSPEEPIIVESSIINQDGTSIYH